MCTLAQFATVSSLPRALSLSPGETGNIPLPRHGVPSVVSFIPSRLCKRDPTGVPFGALFFSPDRAQGLLISEVNDWCCWAPQGSKAVCSTVPRLCILEAEREIGRHVPRLGCFLALGFLHCIVPPPSRPRGRMSPLSRGCVPCLIGCIPLLGFSAWIFSLLSRVNCGVAYYEWTLGMVPA